MCSRACSEPFPLIASDLHKCREQYTLTSGNAIGKTKALFLAGRSAPASHWFSRRYIVAPRFETFPAGNKNRRRWGGGSERGSEWGSTSTRRKVRPKNWPSDPRSMRIPPPSPAPYTHLRTPVGPARAFASAPPPRTFRGFARSNKANRDCWCSLRQRLLSRHTYLAGAGRGSSSSLS